MDNLILSMIAAYNEYGDILGFNKNDIDNLIKKYNYLNNITCNEKGYIMLWKNKYINDKEFSKYMDVELENNILYLVCYNFSDILSNKYNTEIDILNGEIEWNSYSVYDNDIKSYYWRDYNEETIKLIYEFCINKGLEIDGETMTSENTRIENRDILFNDNSISNYIGNENGLDELYDELNLSIINAQEVADQDEAYDMIKNGFIKEIGEYKWKDNKLYIEIDKKWIDEANEFLSDSYGEFDFESEYYGSLLSILKEMEKFDIRFPDLDNIYGSIDDDVLNDYTQERLSFELK